MSTEYSPQLVNGNIPEGPAKEIYLSDKAAASLVGNILRFTQASDEYIKYFALYIHNQRPQWRINNVDNIIPMIEEKVRQMSQTGRHALVDADHLAKLARENCTEVANILNGLETYIFEQDVLVREITAGLIEKDTEYLSKPRPGNNNAKIQSRMCDYVLGEGNERKKKIIRIVDMDNDGVFDELFEDISQYILTASPDNFQVDMHRSFATHSTTFGVEVFLRQGTPYRESLKQVVQAYNLTKPGHQQTLLPPNLYPEAA